MADFANLVLGVDTSGLKRGERALNDTTRAGGRTEQAVKGTGRGFDRAGRSASTATPKVAAFGAATDRTRGMAVAATRAIALMGGAFLAVREISQASQAFANMSNSMRVLGFEAEEVAEKINAIGDIANRTRSPLAATAQLYQRISIAANDLGASQQQVLRFTENVGLALAQQGGSAAQASGALLQLSQAMSGGTVRAEEFNSILEGALPIVQAAANEIEGAAGSVGQLRNMVIAGEISSREFFDAILSSSEALEEAFGKTVPTVSQAITVLSTNFTLFIGQADNLLGVSAALAGVIISLASNLDLLAGVAVAGAVAFGGRYVGAMIAARVATFSLKGALVGLKAALISTGIGALIVGAGVLVGLFSRLVTGSGGFGNALDLLRDVALGVWDKIKAGGEVLLLGLQITFNNINNSFVETLGKMAQNWARFSDSIAETNIGEMMGLEGGNVRATEIKYAAMLNDIAEAHFELTGALGATKERLTGTTAGMDELRAAMAAANEDIDAGVNGAEALAGEFEGVVNAIDGSGGAAGALNNAEEAAIAAADAFNDKLSTAVDGVASAFGDWVASGFQDFKGMVDNILNSFKSMISQMIATAVANPIKLALGIGGGGAAGAVAGGGGGSLLSTLGAGGGIAGSFLSGGAGLVTSMMGGGGLAGAGTYLSAVTTGATASIGSFAAAAGAVALPLLAVAAVFSFLKTKTTELDSGLQITADSTGALVEEFKKIEKSKFWGLSKKVTESLKPLEDAGPITDAIDAIKEQTMGLGSALGLTADNFASFSAQIKVSLKGLSEQEANAAIAGAFDNIAEQLSYAALGHFQEVYGGIIREGDTATSALENMVSALNLVNPTFKLLGFNLFEASVQGAALARNMADTFGGFENFAQSTATYYDKFFSDAEKVTDATGLMSDAFADMNVAMPSTLSAFRALVEQAAAVGNMELAARLIEVSGAFAAMVEGQNALIVSTEGATDAQVALDKALQGVTDAQSTLNSAFADYERAVNRQIATLQADAQTALDPLLAGIADAEAAADNARTAFDGAMSALSGFVSAQISIIKDNLSEAVSELEAVAQAAADLAGEMQSVFAATFNAIMKSLDEQEAQVTAKYTGQINAVSEAMETASASAGLLSEKLALIGRSLASRQLSGIDAERMRYRQSQAALSGFAGGGEFNAKELERVLGGLSDDTTKFFSTREDYQRDFNKTNADLLKLQGGLSGALSIDEQQLAAMADQIAIIEGQRDTELAAIQADRDEAQAIYDATVAILDTQKTGNLTLEGLQSAANDYVTAAQASVAAQESTSAQITLLEKTADEQITLLEAQLAAAQALYDIAVGDAITLTSVDEGMVDFNSAMAVLIEKQLTVEKMKAANEPLIASINETLAANTLLLTSNLEAFRAQVAPLATLPSTISALGSAISGLASATTAAAAANTAAAAAAATAALGPIEQVYQSVLGRAADDAGLAFYRGVLNSGALSLGGITDNIAASSEGANFAATGVPSFDGGGYTGNGSRTGGLDGQGGFLSMLHPQETVTDHTRGGGSNAELVSEMRALNNRVEQLTAYQRQTTINTGNTSYDLKDIRRNGVQVEPVAGAIFNTDEVA